MKVACALTEEDLACESLGVLVLPEGTPAADLVVVSKRHPDLLVVGAAFDGEHMRAHVLVNGRNKIDYLKIRSDGRSIGVGQAPSSAVFETDGLTVGVLICMDVQDDYRHCVREAMLATPSPLKLLCIPADMHSDWFASEPILGWPGIYVALSNNSRTYPQWRARNLIAGPDGHWLKRQAAIEAIVVDLLT